MAAARSELTIAVQPDDIDHLGHVNNAVYLQWVQAVVVQHWTRLAPSEIVRRRLWMAQRHEITYRRPALLGDPVVATTWVESYRGTRARFRTLVRRGTDVLAEIQSTWVCIDAVTRRPMKIGDEVGGVFMTS